VLEKQCITLRQEEVSISTELEIFVAGFSEHIHKLVV
jgi:hypothetical protein